MKRLILFRHAKSSWKDHSLNDFDRPLNKRGEKDAPVMGQRLSDLQIRPDLIVSSPAKRALTTAAIVAEKLGIDANEIVAAPSVYEGSLADLLHVIQHLDNDKSCVILFGHNPGFTYLANQLARTEISNVPTCGVVCVDFECSNWHDVGQEHGSLIFFDFPKNV